MIFIDKLRKTRNGNYTECAASPRPKWVINTTGDHKNSITIHNLLQSWNLGIKRTLFADKLNKKSQFSVVLDRKRLSPPVI